MTAFRGKLWFCSNFYPSECEYDGDTYKTSEHAFQAAKTLDKSKRYVIMNASTPGLAKKLGRSVPLRENWNDIRLGVMKEILQSKFKDPILRQALINTGNVELVEVNEWGDVFWGQCPAGNGENHLGKILMEIRSELQNPSYTYQWPRPAVTSDNVIFHRGFMGTSVLLIQRRDEPFKGQFALPGGYVNEGETFLQCAIRELKEETNLDVTNLKYVGVFDSPNRDPRGWVITSAYTAMLTGVVKVVAGDDAVAYRWLTINEIITHKDRLAFDHYDIIMSAYKLHSVNFS